jgi:mannosyltransferase
MWALLAVCIARLWLVPLSSSFWLDELETVFVAAHPGHPSLRTVHQAFDSIYYWLPRTARAIAGSSEAAYRFPSVLAMAIALFLVAKLAARLIHPRAGWFAVFACLTLRGIDYQAIDARPYALGMAVAAASLYFLIAWLDSARWLDAALFAIFAALLWRVHLVYWPFYLAIKIYLLVRLIRGDTQVTWSRLLPVGIPLIIALTPPALDALTLARTGAAHAFAPLPTLHVFEHELHWNLPLLCVAAAWLLARLSGWRSTARGIGMPALSLILGWWLSQPVVLYLYSHVTGNSLFVARYLSIMLPGVALAATAAAAYWLPNDKWRLSAAVMALAALISQGHWQSLDYRHDISDWRTAAAAVNSFAATGSTAVVVPSPFLEARAPLWKPDYALPGFLYSHLERYPVRGKLYLFPYENKDGVAFAGELAHSGFNGATQFVIYGAASSVRFWQQWFDARPEFSGWTSSMQLFGDVGVAVFRRE